MANNNTHFSEMLNVASKKEQTWLRGLCRAMGADAPDRGKFEDDAAALLLKTGNEEHPIGCHPVGTTAVVLCDEAGATDPFVVGCVVQRFWEEFGYPPSSKFIIQFADVCDKPRPGSFSGGIVTVTPADISVMTTGHLADYFIEHGALPDMNQAP
jgi:hypothetical protein